jgi:hypothetical protein
MIATLVYILCAVTSLTCAVLLVRAYRASKIRFLLWSALCFVFLALNNVLLVIDLRVLTDVDLSMIRGLPILIGLSLLLYGFIMDERMKI